MITSPSVLRLRNHCSTTAVQVDRCISCVFIRAISCIPCVPVIFLFNFCTIDVRAKAIKSWTRVAGSRYEHKEFGEFGHMLARECPNLLAEFFEEHATPDFSHELKHFQTFRTAYRLMRTSASQVFSQAKEIKKSMRVCSPMFGVSAVPMDLDLLVSDLELIVSDTWNVLEHLGTSGHILGHFFWRAQLTSCLHGYT